MLKLVNDVLQAFIAVNYQPEEGPAQGMSYCYWLRTSDWNQARADALEIAELHSWILGANAWIEWVDVRTPKYPHVIWPCLQDPIDALRKSNGDYYWDAPNDGGVTLNLTWKPNQYKGYRRQLYYVADSEITNNRWLRHAMDFPKSTPAKPKWPHLANKTDLFRYAVCRIRDLVYLAKDDGAGAWEIYDWLQVRHVGIGRHHIMPRWWRVSWEAADRNYAPHFSPCGCAVAVRRRCYQQRVQWYANGQIQTINWYFAKPGAKILPFRHSFGPIYGVQQVKNTADVGEYSGTPTEDWTPGLSFGDAPGISPTGGPNAFLGKVSVPYNDLQPTDPAFIPGCDLPVPLPLKVYEDPLSLIDGNTLKITCGDRITATQVEDGWVRLDVDDMTDTLNVSDSDDEEVISDTNEIDVNKRDGLFITEPATGIALINKDSFYPDPTAITADTDDLDPGETNLLHLEGTGGVWELRGIQGGTPGRRLRLRNIGTEKIKLMILATSSAVGNRLSHRWGDFVWLFDRGWDVELVYNDTGSWVIQQKISFEPDTFSAESYSYGCMPDYTTPGNPLVLRPSKLTNNAEGVFVKGNLMCQNAGGVIAGILQTSEGRQCSEVSTTGSPLTIKGFQYTGDPLYFTLVAQITNSAPITLKHQDGTIAAANRLYLPDAEDLLLEAGEALTMVSTGGTGWKTVASPVRKTRLAFNETPGGTMNGINTSFTLTETPLTGKTMIFLNGVLLLQDPTGDYTVSGNTITIVGSVVPSAGDTFLATYQYA